MTHATDGLLQAYLDGEIDGSAEAELRGHLAVCARCSGELEALERIGTQVHASLSLLDAPPPMVRAQAALAAGRNGRVGREPSRIASRSFAKAAMLLLALAGAGAAAIPESPVRRALESTIARVADLIGGETPVAEAPPAVAPVDDALLPAAMGVLPADNRVRVVLHVPEGEVQVTVQLVDTRRALVETATTAEGVRFRTAPGRLEVAGLTAGQLTVGIPRSVQHATVEIGGQVYAYKQGAALYLSGPAGTGRGEQVHFRLGT